MIRTPGTRFRKPLLYPPELQGHFDCGLQIADFGFWTFLLLKRRQAEDDDFIFGIGGIVVPPRDLSV